MHKLSKSSEQLWELGRKYENRTHVYEALKYLYELSVYRYMGGIDEDFQEPPSELAAELAAQADGGLLSSLEIAMKELEYYVFSR